MSYFFDQVAYERDAGHQEDCEANLDRQVRMHNCVGNKVEGILEAYLREVLPHPGHPNELPKPIEREHTEV